MNPNFADQLSSMIKQNAASQADMLMQTQNKVAIAAYKQQIEEAQNKIQNAPGELAAAEKAYYTAKFGLSGYKNFLKNQATNNIKPVIDKYKSNFEKTYANLNNSIDMIDSQNIYSSRIDSLRDNYVKKRINLQKKVDSTTSKSNVNKRLADFYEKKVESNSEINYYLYIIYWILVGFFFIAIIYNKQYKNKLSVGMFALSILLIFTGNYIRKKVHVDSLFSKFVELISQFTMYITFSIRVLLDKLF